MDIPPDRRAEGGGTVDDLISREAAIEAIYNSMLYGEGYKGVCARAIDRIPSVDAVPVVHARWVEKRWVTEYDWGVINHRTIICNACNGEIEDGEKTCYCPNCGAKMDGERRDSE